MIYVETSKEEWIAKYPIQPTVHKCRGCGHDFETSVPIRIKGYIGLETPYHGCERHYLSASFIPITSEEIEYWSSLFFDDNAQY